MNELLEKDTLKIETLIYEIRGKQVMLDSDLAKLYQVETKRINEAVKNNPDKFPERFSWKLTDCESKDLLAEIFDQKNIVDTRGGKYKNPRVFTEQGVAMLATILKSKKAIEISIRIMDTFVKMRHYINYNHSLLPNRVLLLEEKVDTNSKRIDELFDRFSPDDIVANKLFFKGDFYDAYSLLIDIFNKSEQEIIIIDNYIDKSLLDILSKTNRIVTIITNKYNNDDYNKYKKQYNNVNLIVNNDFHDRFIIIDKKILYHCGASFKDLGKKCFEISKLEEAEMLNNLLNKL